MTLFHFLCIVFSGVFFCLSLLCLYGIMRGVARSPSNAWSAFWFYAVVSLFLAWLGDVPLW